MKSEVIDMIKVMTVFGTRPEAIKMAPLVKELQKREEIETIVCVTAQHRQMLDQVLEAFDVTPDYDLDIMKAGQTLSSITADVLMKLEETLKECKPDIVLVHGDTTTAFCASLSAFYKGIKIGHVEAGLRTYDASSPFPEEFNRIAIDLMSYLHFAPTAIAKNNLAKEVCKRFFYNCLLFLNILPLPFVRIFISINILPFPFIGIFTAVHILPFPIFFLV